MLSLFREKERHHAVHIVPIGGRSEQNVDGGTLADAHNARRRIVARLFTVQLVHLVDQNGGKGLGGKIAVSQRFEKFDDLLPLPAEIVRKPDARVRTAVAHGDKGVVFFEKDHRFIHFFPADVQLGLGIIEVLIVAQKNHVRIVVLDQLRLRVMQKMNDGEGRIRNTPHTAYGKRRRNGGNAFLQRQSRRHHGGDDLRRKGRQNARLHTASETVRQYDYRGVLALLHNIHMVAAELFAFMIYAFIADLRA